MSNTVYEGTLPASKTDTSTNDLSRPGRSVDRQDPGRAHQADADRSTFPAHSPPTSAARPPTGCRSPPSTTADCWARPRSPGTRSRACPSRSAIYARGNSTPVLDLKATNISYGAVPASNFTVTPAEWLQGDHDLDREHGRQDRQGGEGRQARQARPRLRRGRRGRPGAVHPGGSQLARRASASRRLAARLRRQAGRDGHLRPEPRRDGRDRAEGRRVHVGARRSRAAGPAGSASRRCRSTARPARSSPPRWARSSASPAAESPTRCSARCRRRRPSRRRGPWRRERRRRRSRSAASSSAMAS